MIDATIFSSSYPRTVECQQEDYEQNKTRIDGFAATKGYSFVGYRLGMAIFSSKRLDPTSNGVCSMGFNHRTIV